MFLLKTFLLQPGIKVHSRTVSSSGSLYCAHSKQKVDKLAFKRQRLEALEHVEKYPHKFTANINIKQLLHKFEYLKNKERSEDGLSVCGMVTSVREMSKKLKFVDMEGGGKKVQLKISSSSYDTMEDFTTDTKRLARGDRIGKARLEFNFT